MNKQIQVDLSQDMDHLFDDPQFYQAYCEASNRSVKISQQIDDECLLDHDPELLADLLLEQMKLFGFSDDECQVFISRFNFVEDSQKCPSLS
jgi:hypothetical protein